MFNVGTGEIALILVVALLVLGPKRLPELARGLGKFLREFRRQTDQVRGVVEREFYRMDQDIDEPPPRIAPAAHLVPPAAVSDTLPPASDEPSQVMAPLGPGSPPRPLETERPVTLAPKAEPPPAEAPSLSPAAAHDPHKKGDA